MRTTLGTRLGATALALTLTSACALACTQPKPAATLSAAESWCPDGFEVGPQDTCFAVPEMTTKETPILVYLHGMYAGHGSPEEWNLVKSATDRGFAVVVPRGKRGLCAWKAELKDHFCWPQEVDDPEAFKHTIAEWERVLWQVEAILEGGSHKRYVLGYSNGGYFASYIAAHGLFPAQAYAIVNGGPLGTAQKPAKAVPLMLVAAQDDQGGAGGGASGASGKTKELHESLTKVGWPHAFCTRPGSHPLATADIEASLRFFKHDADGSLKPTPAGYACEGGATAAASGGEAPATASAPSSASPGKSKK